MKCYVLSRNHPQRMSEQLRWPLQTPQTGRIKQQTFLEAGESKIKMLANSVCGEKPPWGLQTAVFLLCPHTVGRKRSLVSSSSHNGTNHIMGAPHTPPWPHLNLITFLRHPQLVQSHAGLEHQQMNWGRRHKHSILSRGHVLKSASLFTRTLSNGCGLEMNNLTERNSLCKKSYPVHTLCFSWARVLNAEFSGEKKYRWKEIEESEGRAANESSNDNKDQWGSWWGDRGNYDACKGTSSGLEVRKALIERAWVWSVGPEIHVSLWAKKLSWESCSSDLNGEVYTGLE